MVSPKLFRRIPFYYFMDDKQPKAEKSRRQIEIDASALHALCEVDMQLSCGLMRAVAKAAMERLQHTRVQLIAAKA